MPSSRLPVGRLVALVQGALVLGTLLHPGAALARTPVPVKTPIVLVGHSYGGAVISEAAGQETGVKALVYLDALALDAGESDFDIALSDTRPCWLGAGRSQVQIQYPQLTQEVRFCGPCGR